MVITATAPGKAVLSGEYAVLHGAPAIVAAVDRRVRVTVAESRGKYHSLSTPGYLDGTWHFRVDKGGSIQWSEQHPETASFSLVEEVWKAVAAESGPPLSLSIDTSGFFAGPGGPKLGLGSSAAVAVALTAALQCRFSMEVDPSSPARDAHARFQDGRGSGLDIATSTHGGVIEYRRAAAATRPLRWPENIEYRFLWSGRPAATTDKLARLDTSRGQGADDAMMCLVKVAEDVAATWSSGDSDSRQIMEVMRRYTDALRRFSVDLDLGIFDAGHEPLADLAADCGIVYKPCGAGGGDIGIALAETAAAVDAFCDQAAPCGFTALDVAVDEHGVLTQVTKDIE
jgi:phosphomevalonate kinase